MTCAYCGTTKPTTFFIGPIIKECLACWLRRHPESIDAFEWAVGVVRKAAA